MLDKLYKKMSSYENLELAWFRIKTSQNIQYKNYYRNLFLAYELSVKENLQRLSERLSGCSFKPKDVLKFYLPKSSGLHRPITFLHLDDLIVYQAFANIIADKFLEKRKVVEEVTVFSHLLNTDQQTQIFFFKKWQKGYKKFLERIRKYYREGNVWVAHFDLAAYYDTVDHNVLSKQISKGAYKNFIDLLLNCLHGWSTHKQNKLHHGIPQGPDPSGLLSEIYLLPIDIKLKKEKIKYVRYVDDIKIYGKSREDVLSGVILLEKECKEWGLIPQSKKFEVIKADSLEAAIGKHPSLQYDEKKIILTNPNEAYKILKKAFDKNEFDISKIRYILKTSGKNHKILNFILENIAHYPDLADEFCKFLENHIENANVGLAIYHITLRGTSPFEYVEGKYWGLISRCAFDGNKKDQLVKEAIERLKQRRSLYKYSLKLGLYKFMCSTNNSLIIEFLKRENSALIQALVVPYIPLNNILGVKYLDLIDSFLKRSDYEPTLAAIKELLYSFKIDVLKKISLPSKDDSGVIKNTLGKPESVDSIGQIIKNRYEIIYCDKWKQLLGSEYDHANYVIFLADRAYKIDNNAWANYTDSFNDIVIREFINLLNLKKPSVKWPNLINHKKGDNTDFGSLMDKNNQLTKNYPVIIDGLRTFHDRRNKIPSSHPYDKRTKKKTSPLTSREQKDLQKILGKSYKAFIKELTNLL